MMNDAKRLSPKIMWPTVVDRLPLLSSTGDVASTTVAVGSNPSSSSRANARSNWIVRIGQATGVGACVGEV